MKTKIDVKKLQLIEKQQPQKQTKKPVKKGGVSKNGIESRMTRKVSTELDIRGYAADEGVHEMEQFISDAIMSKSASDSENTFSMYL